MRLCRPKTEKLRQLLAECPYRGPEYENGGREFDGGGQREEENEDVVGSKEEKEGKKDQPKKVCWGMHLSSYVFGKQCCGSHIR